MDLIGAIWRLTQVSEFLIEGLATRRIFCAQPSVVLSQGFCAQSLVVLFQGFFVQPPDFLALPTRYHSPAPPVAPSMRQGELDLG